MTNGSRSVFRLRYLLNPLYLIRRGRELGSAENILRAAADVPRYIRGRCESSYHDLRGLPGLLRARTETLYHRADLPYYRSQLSGALSRPTVAPAAPEPAAAPAFERRAPAPLLRQEMIREEAAIAERFRTASPFKHVVIDGFLDPEFCRRLIAEFPPYDAEKFRNEHGHLGKAYHQNVRELGPSYLQLDELGKSPDFLSFMSAITGIPDLLHDPDYVGGGTHENLEDMELDPHVDFTVHKTTGRCRRVNVLLYLNTEWDEAWGGSLELHVNPWLPADQNPIKRLAPAFNRCVLFETSDHSWHGFQRIRLPKDKQGMTRRSFAFYLYTREAPNGFPKIPGDLTVFVDRPLPPEFKAGRRLTEEDVQLLKHLIVRRDWKLRNLYDRAIALYNDWDSSEAQLREERSRRRPD